MSIGLRIGLRSLRVGAPIGVSGDGPPPYRITKTGGVSGNYDAAASTAAVYTGTVSVEWTIVSTAFSEEAAVGLSADNPDTSYTGIDKGMITSSGVMFTTENGGGFVNLGATGPGDQWKIERVIGTGAVTYYKKVAGVWVSQAVSGSTTVAPLLVDTAFRFTSDAVRNVIVTHNGAPVTVSWTAVNVTVS